MTKAIRRDGAGWLLRGLVVSAVTFALLGLAAAAAEWMARRNHWGVDLDDDRYRWTLDFGRPCYRVDVSGDAPRLVRNPTRDGPSRQPPMPLGRSPGVVRIAVIGESNAAILGDELQKRLVASDCASRFEVLSCGAGGSGLQIAQRRLDEILGYAPDAVLLVFGHNFRQAAHGRLPQRTLALLDFFEGHKLLRGLLSSRIFAQLLFGEVGLNLSQADDSDERFDPGESPESMRKSSDRLRRITERAIEEMSARATARGIPLVAVTQVSNLMMPPALPAGAAPDTALLEAHYLDAATGREAALRSLADASDRAPTAAREYQLGQWYQSRGQAVEARRHLYRAVELDYFTPRAPEAMNATMRSLAQSERLRIWDSEALHSSRAPNQIPGYELFHDCCHFLPGALDYSVRGVLQSLASAARFSPCELAPSAREEEVAAYFFLRYAIPPAHQQAFTAPRDWSSGIAWSLARRISLDGDRAAARAEEFLASDDFKSAPESARFETLDGYGWGYREAGRAEQAWAMNERALALPHNARAWVQRALWLLSDGKRDEARAALQKAQSFDEGRCDVRYYSARMDGRPAPESCAP